MEPVPPPSYPRERGTPVYELPLNREGPVDFFPAVCLQSHWDPTAILKRTLPEGYVPQQTDPRPWTRICLEYTTAGETQEPQQTNPDIVMPNGGQFYPPDRYAAAINDESKLRVLDRPLGTCEGNQWEPSLRSDMYDARILIPKNSPLRNPSRIEELAYPRALLRSGPYDCRDQNDKYNTSVSSDYLFNNATKQDRYKQMKKPYKPSAPDSPLKAAPEVMRPDLTFNVVSIDPKNPLKSYEQSARNQRQELLVGSPVPADQVVDKVPTNPSVSDGRFGKYDTHFAPRG
jgi:hypothetical protein